MHMSSYIDRVPFSQSRGEKKGRGYSSSFIIFQFYCYRNSECVSRTTLSNQYFLSIIQFPV